MSLRPLVSVSGLTFGDYLLWNWSLNGNHDVIALVSGLTLPPLVLAFLWLIALNIALLIARTRPSRARRAGQSRRRRAHTRARHTASGPTEPTEAESAATAQSKSSRKLAA